MSEEDNTRIVCSHCLENPVGWSTTNRAKWLIVRVSEYEAVGVFINSEYVRLNREQAFRLAKADLDRLDNDEGEKARMNRLQEQLAATGVNIGKQVAEASKRTPEEIMQDAAASVIGIHRAEEEIHARKAQIKNPPMACLRCGKPIQGNLLNHTC